MNKNELINKLKDIENPGALPKPLKMIIEEDISMPRNPVIAKIFRIAKLAENAGYGFDKMKTGWRPYAKTNPEFEQGLDFTKSIFRLPEKTKTSGQIGGQISGQIGGQIELTQRQIEILSLIGKNNKITRNIIANTLDINESAVIKHLNNLKKKGILKRSGGTRGHWEILDENYKK